MTNLNSNIELKAGDRVRLAGWVGTYEDATACVGTVREYAKRSGLDPETMYQREIERGNDTAYAMWGGTSLVNDRAIADRMAAERKADRERAITVEPGQHVTIEGEVYVVSVPHGNLRGPYHSDPIHFKHV